MIENDMRAVSVCVEEVENQDDEWRFRTRVADPE
jgi:hypothetical protein